MTDNELSPEDDVPVPMHPCVAAYEARLIRLERELPSFERELRRMERMSSRRTSTD